MLGENTYFTNGIYSRLGKSPGFWIGLAAESRTRIYEIRRYSSGEVNRLLNYQWVEAFPARGLGASLERLWARPEIQDQIKQRAAAMMLTGELVEITTQGKQNGEPSRPNG